MRERLTFSNVMSVIAVFIALGGTAFAVKKNSVGSRQVKNDSIKSRDIADGSLKGFDLTEATIGAREIDESKLDTERFIKLKSTTGSCDPSSTSFIDCGAIVLGLDEPSQALMTAGGSEYGSAGASGSCKLTAPGQDPLAPAPTFAGDGSSRDAGKPNGFALTATTDIANLLRPGSNTFRVLCNETTGDVQFSTTLSVVALGGIGG